MATSPAAAAGHLPEADPVADTAGAAEARQGARAVSAGAVRAAAAQVRVPPQPHPPPSDGDVGVKPGALLLARERVAAAHLGDAAAAEEAAEATPTQGRNQLKFSLSFARRPPSVSGGICTFMVRPPPSRC